MITTLKEEANYRFAIDLNIFIQGMVQANNNEISRIINCWHQNAGT